MRFFQLLYSLDECLPHAINDSYKLATNQVETDTDYLSSKEIYSSLQVTRMQRTYIDVEVAIFRVEAVEDKSCELHDVEQCQDAIHTNAHALLPPSYSQTNTPNQKPSSMSVHCSNS